MNLSLLGKTAVICGSTQGIGLAIAQELALLQTNCILLARNPETLAQAVKTLSVVNGQKHHYYVADFTQSETVQKAINEIVRQHQVHILINNTGGPKAGLITDAVPDAFTNAFQQHLVCNHILTQAVIPAMKKAEFGRIINVISTSVKIPLPGLGVSNTIRGAVASWAKTMSNELAAYGITVNNVLPGATYTQRLESILQNTASKKTISYSEAEAEMMKEIPMKRIASANEVAAVAAFLASPAASYITGVSIPVDGGRTGSI